MKKEDEKVKKLMQDILLNSRKLNDTVQDILYFIEESPPVYYYKVLQVENLKVNQDFDITSKIKILIKILQEQLEELDGIKEYVESEIKRISSENLKKEGLIL